MPKIPQENVDQIERGDAEGGGGTRKPFEGFVLAKLIEVEETEVKDSGYAGQNFKYEIQGKGATRGTWVWDYISYAEASTFKFRELFDATGYTYDSDTDELVENEELVILEITAEMQTRGKSAGRWRLNVARVMEPSDENMALLSVTFIDENADSTDYDG